MPNTQLPAKRASKPATRTASVQIIDSEQLSSDLVVELFTSGDIDRVRIELAPEDPEVVAARILQRKLSATSVYELSGSNAIGSKSFIERPFLLQRVEWQGSDGAYADALPFFAVLHGVDLETGEQIVLTSGAKSIVLTAALSATRGWLPQAFRITSTKTANGYDALDLVAVPDSELPQRVQLDDGSSF